MTEEYICFDMTTAQAAGIVVFIYIVGVVMGIFLGFFVLEWWDKIREKRKAKAWSEIFGKVDRNAFLGTSGADGLLFPHEIRWSEKQGKFVSVEEWKNENNREEEPDQG